MGGDYFRGNTDDILSEIGWQSMLKAVDCNKPWDKVVTSPLRRCQDFAKAYSGISKLPLTVEQDLREIHFGSWEKETTKQLHQKYPDQLRSFWTSPETFTPPNGEPFIDFQKRVIDVWNAQLNKIVFSHTNGILLITHGGVIRVILAWILKIPLVTLLKIELPMASISRIQIMTDQHNNFIYKVIFIARKY